MAHDIHSVETFEVVGPFTLRVEFEDGIEQTINFEPILAGEIFGPLRDRTLFEAVEIDPEAHTLIWPNGADFDPETLYHWPKYEAAFRAMAQRWADAEVRPT